MVELAEQYTMLAQWDNYFVGLCPFVAHPRPAFYVFPKWQMWRCVACHSEGDADSFIRKVEQDIKPKECFKCHSLRIRQAIMTPDEERFGFDMYCCDICGAYQNRITG
jgi:hypothetical protein